MASAKSVDKRARGWICIVYPESAVENWRSIIAEMQVEAVISPLHDKDIDPDGTLKKAHHHVVFAFEGVKSYEQIKEITDQIKALPPIPCKSIKATVRYMTHMDNPEKAQYPRSEIVALSGFDLDGMFALTSSDEARLLADIVDFIRDHEITEFCDLADYAMKFQFDSWWDIVNKTKHAFLSSYIRSYRHKHKKPEVQE